ncbi:hypothetical protein PsorP6_006277 [Peronosclerospora sorghi]|uniref:Uncharacterized protein n=1 Tax=Peronosclerospora sorghi TaxID=230839 RepID=A0ACC0W3A8_9STRA|nr:hypothetical protein PsorP6_006277 [Peronosclerospora sorghi]
MENMDVYSNVLYVKEKKTELSRLAHRALKVEKCLPETCCIIGKFYSIKNKHDRAIIYFYRDLKLDPNFLSAWTIYYYRKSVAIRPYDARMWFASGICYEKLNKVGEAVSCFHRAVNNQDREGIASYHLGRLYASRGLQPDATKFYQIHLGLRSVIPSLSKIKMSSKDSRRLDRTAIVKTEENGYPQALAEIVFLAHYYKHLGRVFEATIFFNCLLDMQGPEKEEAKALLREMHSLESNCSNLPSLEEHK